MHLPYVCLVRSPRMRRASCMSLGMIVTRWWASCKDAKELRRCAGTDACGGLARHDTELGGTCQNSISCGWNMMSWQGRRADVKLDWFLPWRGLSTLCSTVHTILRASDAVSTTSGRPTKMRTVALLEFKRVRAEIHRRGADATADLRSIFEMIG